ncbi:glycerol-3-phosphate acyltransferase 2, mitochondrial isoform X2 [Boleophthalmus pectinirostris]|uniref:glycerol-3-phosphate acyltransferase 2, mitochondrial isoform X2 n=1 Tax=Boleophthalmus pectinirostris TaxID=150288 RepID=UPI00242B4D40|nr:glycerol-3-phosphate acyltransferase 2, mitochondrial isoform X2 [Boleophthalmus pectinirostris]
MGLQPIEPHKPLVSWGLKIKTKTKVVPPCLGMFRPTMGHCCHQCTPESLRNKFEQNSLGGFCNILNIKEKHTRYQGWLVRRMCCALFVSGCKAFTSPVTDRAERVYQSKRVKEALAAEPQAEQGQISRLPTFLPLINTCITSGLTRFVSWLLLKMLASVFGSVQVNLNHLLALHKASQEGSPLVYVYLQQSALDCALIPLALFCHSLRIPYTICPVNVNNRLLRMILQKVGVILLLNGDLTEEEFERDPLSSAVMTSLVRELLHEGQAVSVAVSALPGQGGQWLARIRQLIKEGSVPDVSLVPVGISYNCVPPASPQIGLSGVVKRLLSLLWTRSWGSVRIDLAQPFSLKEMCDSGRCRVDDWLPLQDLLLPVILNNRSEIASGRRRMSWLLPLHYASEPKPHLQDGSIAIILHLIYSAMSCKSVMSTGIVSSLLLHRHPKGVKLSVLCRDVSWLTKELLFRNKDVGFGGTLARVVHYALSLLAPHLIMSAAPSRKDPLILPRPSPAAAHHLSLQAQTVTHAFILEAVGACAVSAMLRDVAGSGVSSHVRSHGVDGAKVKGDLEFDVVLCETELTNRALQLCHLLPPGFMPPCQSSHSFALDAVDSLVRCGILIMEEVPRAVPICDVWKRDGTFSWATSDDPYSTDSDCEEMESRSYKITKPSQCPDLLFFLCSLLSEYLRSLCWATSALENQLSPLLEADFKIQIHCQLCDMARKKKMHYESCSVEAVHTALRTLIDLGVSDSSSTHVSLKLSAQNYNLYNTRSFWRSTRKKAFS